METPKAIPDSLLARDVRRRVLDLRTPMWTAIDMALERYVRKNSVAIPPGMNLIRMVGGSVRDCILGMRPKDIDFCTPLRPEQLIEAFKVFGDPLNSLNHPYEVIPTGLQHGTITLLFPETREQFEITTLRSDVATDGRHAEVEFVTDYRTDAERRDFTMNAMSVNWAGDLFDYFGGLEDLMAKRVRFVGDPKKRITEDYLRIMRFYRFSARMGNLYLDAPTARALSQHMADLKTISGERIWAELSKILLTPDSDFILEHMAVPEFFPYALGVTRWDDRAVKLQRLTDEGDELNEARTHGVPAIALLYGWFRWYVHDLGPTPLVEQLTKRLALSRDETDMMTALIKRSERAPMPGHPSLYQDVLNGTMNHEHALVYECMHGTRGGLSVRADMPRFPIRGQDLLDMGMTAGPDMGKTMKDLRSRWAQTDGTLTRDELLDMARKSSEVNHG